MNLNSANGSQRTPFLTDQKVLFVINAMCDLPAALQEREPDTATDNVTASLEGYRSARERMLAVTMKQFPAGSRVQPVGTTTGNWGATVRELKNYDRLQLSADMVWLDWDNGNKFAMRIDEIEHEKRAHA